MRKVPPLVAVLLLAIISWSGCAVDAAAKKEEKGRQVDPLVRERTLARMDEISKPARAANDTLKAKAEAKDCAGVCEASKDICVRSARVCDLAADYPATDDDIQERCDWVSSDCDESRGLCANCGGAAPAEDY